MQIKTLQLKHRCSKVFSNFHLVVDLLYEEYLERFRVDPNWSLQGLIDAVKMEKGYDISRSKAWRVKNKCLRQIFGDETKQYSRLFAYRNEIMRSNPGSTVEIRREDGRFKGFYVCLNPLKEAYKRGLLRSIVCVDGCWLKTSHGGQLLSVVTLDPSDIIFPIAWFVVEKEDKQT